MDEIKTKNESARINMLKNAKVIDEIIEQPLIITSSINTPQPQPQPRIPKNDIIEQDDIIVLREGGSDLSQLIRLPYRITASNRTTEEKTCECCCKLCNCCKIPVYGRYAFHNNNNSLCDKIIYWLDKAFIRYESDTCEMRHPLCLFSCKCKFCY